MMLSIIIPAYNATTTIGKCLKSLLNQTIDREHYEVLVVDDGSTDDTSRIIATFSGVTLIKQRNQGPAAARNKGVEKAKGALILFTDSDCTPTTNWIEEMIRPFREDRDIVGVKGIYKTNQRNLIARFVQIEYEDKYDIMKRYKYIDFIDTYSAAYKKDVFLEAGGYDASFPVACAEDVELSYRLSQKGHKMVFNAGAIVYHVHPSRLIDYFKKKYKFAYWRVVALRNNRDKALKDSHTPQVMKLQAIIILLLSILFVVAFFSSVALKLMGYLILFYLLTTIPFTLKAMKKDKLVGLISPGILFLRSIAQCFGLTMGILVRHRT